MRARQFDVRRRTRRGRADAARPRGARARRRRPRLHPASRRPSRRMPRRRRRSRRRCWCSRCSGRYCRRGRGGSRAPSRPAAPDQVARGDQHRRRAKAALQRVMPVKAVAQRRHDRDRRRSLRWSRPRARRRPTASIRQARAGSPSTRTVQAPHTPCSQPRCVPVRLRRSRRKSASDSRGGTSSAIAAPLSLSRTAVMRLPACAARIAATVSRSRWKSSKCRSAAWSRSAAMARRNGRDRRRLSTSAARRASSTSGAPLAAPEHDPAMAARPVDDGDRRAPARTRPICGASLTIAPARRRPTAWDADALDDLVVGEPRLIDAGR